MNGGGARAANMKFPTAKTLEKYNPAVLLIDKHKKLSLADAQVATLKQEEQRIFERNAMLLARYDSLQRDFRPPSMRSRDGGGTDPRADSTLRVAFVQMRQLRMLADSLQDRRRIDEREVLGTLADEGQRKKAAELLDKQDEKFSKEFPAAPTQRGNRGPGDEGGAGRGGRRPASTSARRSTSTGTSTRWCATTSTCPSAGGT